MADAQKCPHCPQPVVERRILGRAYLVCPDCGWLGLPAPTSLAEAN